MVEPRPRPAGFGNCPDCAYVASGPASLCFDCASRSLEPLAARRCALCARPLEADGTCGNPVCSWAEEQRWFRSIWAIAMRSGPLQRAIDDYKVPPERAGWSWIFGRVLLGYLNAHAETFGGYGLIVPSPTFTGEGGRAFDHTAAIIERAVKEDEGDWPFALDVIQKTGPTTPFRGRTWPQRHAIAMGELRDALVVAEPARVAGERVLVFDDVYTEGLTILEVARSLRLAGAAEVSQIVLARQPWGRR
jgi:predicted amidophosphoribosyltransferase